MINEPKDLLITSFRSDDSKGLDSMPLSPARLPSPTGKTNYVYEKRRSESSNPFSHYDALPPPPSRYLSPATRERRRVEVPDQIKETLSPSLTKDSSLSVAMRVVHHTPLEPTVSSHETSIVSEDDIRVAMLNRIPPHIRSQLPLKEWYRILRPSLLIQADCADCSSICSELSNDFSDYGSEITPTQSEPSAATGEVFDDLYGTGDEGEEEEEGTMAHEAESNRVLKTQHSALDATDAHRITEDESKTQENGDDQMIEETAVAADGALKSSEQERTIIDDRANSWMDKHILAYHAICCTDQESKGQELEDNLEELEVEDLETDIERDSTDDESAIAAEGERKSVSFGRAQVRWHERILDVHPCTSSGPSIGIGWKYTEGEEPIEWERRTPDDIRLSRQDREKIITELGYSTRDIAKAVRKTLKIKNQRRTTINNLQGNVVNVEKVESMAENVQRKVRKLHKKLRSRNSY